MHEPTAARGDTIHPGGFDRGDRGACAYAGSICLLTGSAGRCSPATWCSAGRCGYTDQSALPHTAVATYAKLAALAADVDHVPFAHGTAVLPGSFLQALAEGTAAVAEGLTAGAR